MTTVRDIVKTSLLRLRRLSLGAEPNADIAEHARGVLNQLIYNWAPNGVDVKHQGFASLDDLFVLLIPPHGTNWTTIDALSYAGTWNASTNSPTLASASGTDGYAYRVSTAGTTTLDDVTSWSVGEFALFNGSAWVKGESASWHEQGVAAMLAERLAPDFGIEARQEVIDDARGTFKSLLGNFITAADVDFDKALTRLPSRRWPYSVPSDTI